jgi:outer membrane protein assembly factor BamB
MPRFWTVPLLLDLIQSHSFSQPWPSLAGGPGHCGVRAPLLGPRVLNASWCFYNPKFVPFYDERYPFGNAVVGLLPNDGREIVYVWSGDQVLVALDGNSTLWTYGTSRDDDSSSFGASGALSADGSTLFTFDEHTHRDILALNATNGSLLWTSRVPQDTEVPLVSSLSLVPSSGHILVTGLDNVLLLNSSDGSVLWNFDIPVTFSENIRFHEAGVLVESLGLFIVGGRRSCYVYALSVADGSVVYNISRVCEVGTLVYKDIFAAGPVAGVNESEGVVFLGSSAGELLAIQASNGTVLWRQVPVTNFPFLSVALSPNGSLLYVLGVFASTAASGVGCLFAANGTQKWVQDVNLDGIVKASEFPSLLVSGEGLVYTLYVNKTLPKEEIFLAALGGQTGQLLALSSIPSGAATRSLALGSKKLVYVPSRDGRLCAFGETQAVVPPAPKRPSQTPFMSESPSISPPGFSGISEASIALIATSVIGSVVLFLSCLMLILNRNRMTEVFRFTRTQAKLLERSRSFLSRASYGAFGQSYSPLLEPTSGNRGGRFNDDDPLERPGDTSEEPAEDVVPASSDASEKFLVEAPAAEGAKFLLSAQAAEGEGDAGGQGKFGGEERREEGSKEQPHEDLDAEFF